MKLAWAATAAWLLTTSAWAQGLAPGTRVEFRNPGTDTWREGVITECIAATGRCQIDSWSDTLNAVAHRGYFSPQDMRVPGGRAAAPTARPASTPSATAAAARTPTAPRPAASTLTSGLGGCKLGARVTDRDGNSGVVSEVRDSTSCWVKLDNGKRDYYLGWMLTAGGGKTAGPAPAGGGGLATGRYQCVYPGGGGMMIGGGDINIDSASSYRGQGGAAGRMQVSGSEIRFLSGPFAEFQGSILAGGRIGLRTKGQSINSMTCQRR